MRLLDLHRNPDRLGIIASSLCLAHCLVTPFLFLAQTGLIVSEETHSFWWKSLDFIFLGLSFIAVHKTTQTTSNQKLKYLFWIGWSLLFTIIINEKIDLLPLAEELIYVVAIFLVSLHFYNQKYCRCNDKKCCIN
ncbi:MerC domain-containing protein [uncultured Aquimarina sp.]|uniref:MerC domain-containing protein n=1 Tax=uncultured Aquimarina sp. TaxID=575652 RepID=UPI0026137457|nr:MerC domain-containing protein [uncultured Aquimarina sp.]